MWKKLTNLFKKSPVQVVNLSPEKIKEIKANNLYPFTENLTLLIKDNKVLGKISKTERIKPGTLIKGTLTFIYMYEATTKTDREEFIDKECAINWLLQQTRTLWFD
jgi:hypothetical protein